MKIVGSIDKGTGHSDFVLECSQLSFVSHRILKVRKSVSKRQTEVKSLEMYRGISYEN